MRSKLSEEETLRSYLLGDLATESRERLENRLMTEKTLLQDLSIAEEELIDDYVSGELEPAARESFESSFLGSPQRRRQLQFAVALKKHVDEAAAPVWPEEQLVEHKVLPFAGRLARVTPSQIWQTAMAATLVFVLATAAWLAVGNHGLQRRIADLTASQQALRLENRTRAEQLAAEQARNSTLNEVLRAETSQIVSLEEELEALRMEVRRRLAEPMTAIATLWLRPGLLRGGGQVERLVIPGGSTLVRLRLDLGVDDYSSYRASLQDAIGDEIWSQSKLAATKVEDRVAIELTLPTDLVPPGDYSIRLSGIDARGDLELIGRYYFRALSD